jgi:hypothetical protein
MDLVQEKIVVSQRSLHCSQSITSKMEFFFLAAVDFDLVKNPFRIFGSPGQG